LATGDGVGPAAAFEAIVAEAAEDRGAGVGIGKVGGNDDMIVAIGRRNRGSQRPVAEAATVGKKDFGDNWIDVAGRIDQRDAVVRATDRQHTVAVGVPRR